MTKLTFTALAVATALTLAACGEGDPATDGPGEGNGEGAGASAEAGGGAGDLTEVTIGTLPILPTAVIELGIDQGIFEEEGLSLTLETGQGGAALVPAVIGGAVAMNAGTRFGELSDTLQEVEVFVGGGLERLRADRAAYDHQVDRANAAGRGVGGDVDEHDVARSQRRDGGR